MLMSPDKSWKHGLRQINRTQKDSITRQNYTSQWVSTLFPSPCIRLIYSQMGVETYFHLSFQSDLWELITETWRNDDAVASSAHLPWKIPFCVFRLVFIKIYNKPMFSFHAVPLFFFASYINFNSECEQGHFQKCFLNIPHQKWQDVFVVHQALSLHDVLVWLDDKYCN